MSTIDTTTTLSADSTPLERQSSFYLSIPTVEGGKYSPTSMLHISPPDDLSSGDRLAKESDVTVGGDAVPPETEYFGFALYVGSLFAIVTYLLWAFLPRSVLYALHIYYFPSRWWALAIPCYLLVTIMYIYVALASYNTEILTKPVSNLCTVTDKHSKVITFREFECEFECENTDEHNEEDAIGASTHSESPTSGMEQKMDATPNLLTSPEPNDGSSLTNQSTTASQQDTEPLQNLDDEELHEIPWPSILPQPSDTTHSNETDAAIVDPEIGRQKAYRLYQQKYLFGPSDGVWDLPLSEVCKLLYGRSTPQHTQGNTDRLDEENGCDSDDEEYENLTKIF